MLLTPAQMGIFKMPIVYGCKGEYSSPCGSFSGGVVRTEARAVGERRRRRREKQVLWERGCCEGVAYVSAGCWNKCHRLGGLNNKLLFLTAGKPGSPRSRRRIDLGSSESPLLGLQTVFSCPRQERRQSQDLCLFLQGQ